MTASADPQGLGGNGGYIHGYSAEEQARLLEQARFLEPQIYQGIDFSRQKNLIELGCGVGAQTEILLKRFPHLKIHGVDASAAQIGAARGRLARFVDSGQVSLTVGHALKLDEPQPRFDAAHLCWFLEHVQEPVEILRELRRVLLPGAVLYCTEVMNFSFFIHPYSPATLQYWFAFNDQQWNLKGDPFVGAKLGNYLAAAGFRDIQTFTRVYHYDNRTPKERAAFIDYWTPLLLSGAPGLLAAGKISAETVDEMKRELKHVATDPDAVFFYAWAQARAVA